jgi:hypothetical protein
MGVYTRPNSPYFWLRLERPGLPALRESTKIPKQGLTPKRTRELRQDADDAYLVRMAELARARYELPPAQPDEPDAPEPSVTFAAFAAWYEEHKIPTHRGDERDREMLANLIAFFGPHELAAIDDTLVTEYESQRTATDGKKASTANREVDLLKTILKAAVPRYLEQSPIAGRRRLHCSKIRKRVVEAAEEPRLLAELPPRDQVLYVCCVDTLARLSNILDLKRTDDHRTFLDFLDSKTGPYRTPVSARLRAGLDSLPRGTRAKDLPYYFWWRRRAATERDRRGGVRTMLMRAAARAGIPYGRAVAGITWHTATRATGATRMLRRGVDPATVQGIGNWASLEQMSDYLQTTTPLQQAAVELIAAGTDLAAATAAAAAARKARASRKNAKRPDRKAKQQGGAR